MGREREVRRSSARRGRRSDPRLRGLSYPERRRVYLRRRIVAVVVIVALLLLLAVLVGLIPLFGGLQTGSPTGEAASNAGEPAATKQPAPTGAARDEVSGTGAEPLDVLVLGVDRRPEGSSVEGSRSDTIMVVRILPGTGEVRMLSIPRDLFVEIEPGVEDRINAAYSYGGVDQITRAAEKATGISIDRYAVVDFEGFRDIVDAVGGLRVEIQDQMPPGRQMQGTQTLNGQQALFYARYRGTPGGDLDRIARQQQLVGALREKLVSWGAVSKLPGIMEAVHGNLETDLGLGANISLARSLLNAEGTDSALKTLQFAGSPTTLPDGRQVLAPNPAENEKILQEFHQE